MTNFWNKFFVWLERVLPSALASFVFGYKMGNKDKQSAEAKLLEVEYKLKKKIAEEEAKQKYVGKSNDDIVNEFLSDDESGKGQ